MKIVQKLLSVFLVGILIIGMVPVSAFADSYTVCASGTVTWKMIYDNPGTYYWYYSKGETYCVLTAVESGSAHYVTLNRPDKSGTRYLKLNSDDDSGSKYDWGSSAHTGGVLYKKGDTSSGEDGGSGSSVTALSDGVYQATSTGVVNKDDESYAATVTLTVSGGKITELTASGPTTSKNKEYFEEALSAIRSKLLQQTATTNSYNEIDAVSGATKSLNILKEAIKLALNSWGSSSSAVRELRAVAVQEVLPPEQITSV